MREVKKAIEKKGTKEEAFEEILAQTRPRKPFESRSKAVPKPFQSRFLPFPPASSVASCSG